MTAHDVPPPDLEMRVSTTSESGRTRLTYTLHSPNGKVPFSHREIAGPALAGSPEDLQRRLLHKIEQLGLRQDVDGSGLLRVELDRKLKGLGRDLWRELFPAEIRHTYREILRSSVRSWMIVSDEPWIPWELVKPYDDSRPEEILDDEFLALRFELTRWLAGDKTPAHHIAVRSLAVFRTADLPHSELEREVLMGIVRSRPALRDATPPRAGSASGLLRFLETGDAGLLHFIGHGTHDVAQADESGIPFPDRSVLRPTDLEGPPATRVGRIRPLVFQNSCWAGQQGWSFTLLGGWAARWVKVCGCGAFVAPLWPSRDKTALSFARTFYKALEQGATLGRAALEARQQVARERPGDPSALAYTVYGHPNARLWFGEIPSEVSSPEFSFSSPLPFLETEELPSRGFRSRRVWMAAAAAFAVLLGTISGTFPGLWTPEGLQNEAFSPLERASPAEPPKEPLVKSLGLLAREPDRKPPTMPPAPVEKETRSAKAPIEKASTAPATGVSFEISAARGVPKSVLAGALRSAAVPLADRGISGWVIHLDVDAPRITPHARDGASWEACSLSAQGHARGQGLALDLGPMHAVNSQTTDSTIACEEAAKSLAKEVIYGLVTSIRKGAT